MDRFLRETLAWEAAEGPTRERVAKWRARANLVIPQGQRETWVEYMLERPLSLVYSMWYESDPRYQDAFRCVGQDVIDSAVARYGGAVFVHTHVGPYFASATSIISDKVRLLIPVDGPFYPIAQELWNRWGTKPNLRYLIPVPTPNSEEFLTAIRNGYFPHFQVDHSYNPAVSPGRWARFVIEVATAQQWPLLPVSSRSLKPVGYETTIGTALWTPDMRNVDASGIRAILNQWVRAHIANDAGRWWGWAHATQLPNLLVE